MLPRGQPACTRDKKRSSEEHRNTARLGIQAVWKYLSGCCFASVTRIELAAFSLLRLVGSSPLQDARDSKRRWAARYLVKLHAAASDEESNSYGLAVQRSSERDNDRRLS